MKIFLLVVSCIFAVPASAQVYVDRDATGANNGSSWADAYPDLQQALAATSSGEIWVAEGRYHPGSVGQSGESFRLKSGVALYGGFAGVETARGQRNVALYPTLLDGDLAEDDTYGTGSNWWQFQWTNFGENSGRVVDASGVDASAVLDGFSITAGYGINGSASNQGAGLFILNGSPTVRQCTFRYNSYARGAAVYVDGGSPSFSDCTIRDGYNFGRTASGVYVDRAQPVFTGCSFINHYTVTLFGGNDGSAVCAWFDADTTFIDCEFVDNQIGNWFAQGDPSGSYGAGIFNMGKLRVDRCSFLGGYGNGGSGITTYGGLELSNSLFFDNFARPYALNAAVDDGDIGAAVCFFGNSLAGKPRSVDSCTFVNNYCDKGAGIYVSGNDAVPVRHCILFFNDGPTAPPGEDQTPVLKRQVSGKVDLEFCCVEELWQKSPNEDPLEAPNFPGCMDQGPRFVNWVDGDLHLLAQSPCMNSGASSLLPPGLNEDREGNSRQFGSELDLGCYESALTAEPSLTATSFVTEVPAEVIVFNALPGELVHFVYSTQGVGVGPGVPALGGLRLGVLPPVKLFRSVAADVKGRARLTVPLPANAPLLDLYLQGAIARGVGGSASVLTNTVTQHIYLKP